MSNWALALFDRSVHPTQVAVMEAFDWIGKPFSPVQFAEMGDPLMQVNRVAYHMRALAAIGLIEVVNTRRVRGAIETIYAPVDP
ncbi:MAG TPA: hypothetical protein VMH33_07740 [Solirubrobacterales bacterium]|nr:hypothetical protein [Solirubrobacterales bacterium]